ncbi:glycosyl transferase family protein [Bacillus freudenreichii]|nr:glycosyl transferase family protein [Bacillus freudenreichii]
MAKPKVSVVVPVYKVEKFIHRCLKSIVRQTYWNLEIILVNDGSPDQCGAIIEEYAAEDGRIITVHKENGGLSDARNAGMQLITGDFTLFVDSDDWLAEKMIEELVYMAIYCRADVVQSAFYYAYDGYMLYDNRYYQQDESPVLLNNRSLMLELVKNETVKNFAWGKLYKTELIKDIPFKKGVLFEDVFWAHQVMSQVKNYVILHEPLCYYYQREDSIVANYSPKNLDILRGLKERHKFIEEHYQELTDESYRAILKVSLLHYNLLFLSKNHDKKGIYKKAIQEYIKQNQLYFQDVVKMDKDLKRQLYLFLIHPSINITYLGTKKILRSINLLPKPQGLARIDLKV